MHVNQWQGYNFARERTFLGGNVSGDGQFNNYWSFWMNLDWGMTNLSSTALRGGPSMKTPGSLACPPRLTQITENPCNLVSAAGSGGIIIAQVVPKMSSSQRDTGRAMR